MHTVNVEWLQCMLPCFTDVGRRVAALLCSIAVCSHCHISVWAHGKSLSISADSVPWKICFVFLDSVPFNAGSLSSRVGREPGASGVSATWLRVVNSEVVRILS